MGLFDFLKKTKPGKGVKASGTDHNSSPASKEDMIRMILEMQGQKAPSDHFASGAVFDISKQNRALFLDALRSNNALALLQLFIQSYLLFLEHPEVVGLPPQMINRNHNDTDPAKWNADIFTLPNGRYAALLFMPVQNEDISARMAGIIFDGEADGFQSDGYYYCMLDRNENAASGVFRNYGLQGVQNIGAVKGRGFELMQSFLNCMKDHYFSE